MSAAQQFHGRASRYAAASAPSASLGLPVAPDSFSPPLLDEMSVTVWPVHALSISRSEWVEMVWAARNAVQEAANLERRGWFEGVKCLLQERDLPPSKKSQQRAWTE